MSQIHYRTGDATLPQGEGNKILCHVCNDIGAWGKGFVLAISKRWVWPEEQYRAWHASGQEGGFALGQVQFVRVEKTLWVANMIAQHGIKRSSVGPPIRYGALDNCLVRVAHEAYDLKASVHMPRIGCGLAGGKWSEVERAIQQILVDRGAEVYVYDLEPK